MSNKPEIKPIVKSIMELQMDLIHKHPSVGPTCLIGLDKENPDNLYLVPCITAPEDLLVLADKLELSAKRIREIASKTTPQTKVSVH